MASIAPRTIVCIGPSTDTATSDLVSVSLCKEFSVHCKEVLGSSGLKVSSGVSRFGLRDV